MVIKTKVPRLSRVSINNAYVDGVSLTHGQSPRQHIWTFANAVDDYIFYPDDSLWDSQGTSTCCEFKKPPWFCKELPQSTTDNIELRLCGNRDISNEIHRLKL